MKRAKIILTALTVLTVVGGALAFKGHRTLSGVLQCTDFTPNQTFICPDKTYSEDPEGTKKKCKPTSAGNEVECTTATVVFNP